MATVTSPVADVYRAAKRASRTLAQLDSAVKDAALESIAETLMLSTNARYQPAGLTPLGEDACESAMLDAVAADPRLTGRQRAPLREIHEALVATLPRASCRTSRTESSARGPQTGSRGK